MLEEKLKYSMLIEWSDEDQAYLVTLPEWTHVNAGGPHTHGDTYIQAVKMGQECLELLVESARKDGEAIPEPAIFTDKGEDNA